MDSGGRQQLLRTLIEAQRGAGYSAVGRSGAHPAPSLRDSLGLGPETLSTTGLAALDLAEHLDEEIPELEVGRFWHDLTWRVAAWSELACVLDVRIDSGDATPDLLRQHHCYWEAHALIREQVIALLNGQLSLWATSLRPLLELTVAEAYFRVTDSLLDLRRWLDGEVDAPKWDRMMKVLGKHERFVHVPRLLRRLHHGYATACRYAHKPDSASSLLGARGTNQGYGNLETFFRVITEEALLLQTGLGALVLAYPSALIPLDPVVKFGFNGPIGLFVGPYEVETIRRALGDDDFTALQAVARQDRDVEALREFYESHADLSPEQVERSAQERADITGFDANDTSLSFETRLMKWNARQKAWLFATSLNFNYMNSRDADKELRSVDLKEATRLFPRAQQH